MGDNCKLNIMKYKIIKEYPGSPSLGCVINKETLNWSAIKNYSEFWEEVIEKDYEILSILIRRSDKHQQTIVSSTDSDDYITSLINCDGNSIHSIKRLSDGEIFTIGDNVKSSTCNVPNTILSIELINNKIRVYPRNSFYYLNDVKKVKQPLFKTEDGVDIFESDKTYYVFNDLTHQCNSSFQNKWEVLGGYVQNYNFNKGNEYYKVFSTKEKAEEYIVNNKPCLSLNDYYSLFDDYIRDNGIGKKLQELIKQKLK
jgi:hypothetical protein